MKKPADNSGFSPIIAIIIIVALVAVGLLFAQNAQLKNQLAQTQPTSASLTANWKTYFDPSGKFSYRYPPNWDSPASNCPSHSSNFSTAKDCVEMVTYQGKVLQSIQDPPDLASILVSENKIKVDNLNETKKLFTDIAGKPTHIYEVWFFQNSSPKLLVSAQIGFNTSQKNTDKLISTLDQILSTFKFIQ